VVATALALHTDDLTGRRERDHIIEWKATMRTVWNSVVLVCALILTLPVAQMTLSAGAETGASHTVVAASGTAAPAGGNYATFTHVTVNARSQIAFDASLGGPSTSGVFVGDGRRTATNYRLDRHLSVEKHGGRLVTYSQRERGHSGPGLEPPAVTGHACELSRTQRC